MNELQLVVIYTNKSKPLLGQSSCLPFTSTAAVNMCKKKTELFNVDQPSPPIIRNSQEPSAVTGNRQKVF
jgi:hypothetical protein